MDYENFIKLLSSMRSSEDEERKNAEEIFTSLVQENGMLVIQYLLTIIQQNQANIHLINFALLLFINIYRRYPMIFQPDSDSTIQSFFLALLDNPSQDKTFQSSISSLIASAAKLYFPNERWPSFPSDLIQRCASDNFYTVLISLDCLILSIHSQLFDFQSLIPVVDSLFQKFWESQPSQVHLHLITLIFILFQNGTVCQCFEPFITTFPQFLFQIESVKIANSLISELTNYSESIIPFFQATFPSLFECLINIITETGRDSGERKLCLELLCEITESNPSEMSQTIEPLFTTLMNLICEISGPDFIDDDYEDPTPRTAAEKSLSRFSSSFNEFCNEQNSDSFQKLLLNIFDQFNQCTTEFEKYRASFVLLRETFDILVPSFQNGELIDSLVQKIIDGIHCQNMFCEIAVFQVLTEAAVRLSNNGFEKDYNAILIPAIIEYITGHAENSRFALESLSMLLQYSNSEDFDVDFEQIFTFITQIFEAIPLQAKLYALKCITSLIQISQDRITQYYPIILTILEEIIKANETSLQIESIFSFSMIGHVLPQLTDSSPELMGKFAQDAQEFIKLIISINRSNLTQDQDETLNNALGSLVWALGESYPDAFPDLLANQIELAAQDIKLIKVPLSSDRSDLEGYILLSNKAENMLYAYDEMQISAVNHTLSVIKSFLMKIGNHSLSLLPQLFELFSKTISYFFDTELQISTIECLAELVSLLYHNKCESYNDFALIVNSFNSVCENPYEDEDTILDFINFSITLSNCSPNLEIDLIHSFLELVGKCSSHFDTVEIHRSCALLLKSITKSPNLDQAIVGNLQQLSQTYFPSPDKADENLVDGSIIFWSSLVINIMHSQGDFDNIFDFSCAYIQSTDNIVSSDFLMVLPSMIESEMFGPPHLEKILPVLLDFLSFTNPDDEDSKNTIDAAVYVLTCIFLKIPDTTQNPEILTKWYECLPLSDKKDPCYQKVYDVLVTLVSQNNPLIMGALHHLLTIIATVMEEYNASEQAQDSFRQIIKHFYSTAETKEILEQELENLTSDEKDIILSLLQEDETQ